MKNKQIELLVERYPVLKAIENEVFNAYQILENCYAHGGKLLVAGNGGSAADAEHIVGELMKGFKLPRKPDADFAEKLIAENQKLGSVLAENLQGALPAIALDGHPALSTAYMNDCEPLLCFAQQVNGYGKTGDVFLGISTSGNSKNVLYLQKENLLNEKLQEIEIFDKSGLFSNGRLRDEDVPEGLYRYDLRGSDYDPGQPITVEKTVVVNHAASVLMAEELDLGAKGRLELGEEGLNFTGAELIVREFMEEQQQKNNALIHGDSDHIAVEGHIGTWYAVDETEIGGEKFFLLEHEEHGDMAACVAVNEQGKLVAEDLWNGFDEDFQEAVQKYLSEKWNMPKKEDVVSEIIEKAAPVPDNSAQDYSDVPVYYEPFSYAKENDEVDLYRISYRLNSECKQAIHEAIADNYDGMYLGDDAVSQVVQQYGMERVGYILANTLHHKSYDGRFSHSNKEWAEQVSTPEHNADRMTFRTDWVVDSHPAILDGFVTMFRKELEAQKEQEQPFVKQFYVVENMQAAPLKIERFGNLNDAMSQYQALPNHYMKALGVEKNPDPLPGSLGYFAVQERH